MIMVEKKIAILMDNEKRAKSLASQVAAVVEVTTLCLPLIEAQLLTSGDFIDLSFRIFPT